jgi:hypothetical protein
MIDMLLEKYLGNVKEKWKTKNQDSDVFINPDRKELQEVMKNYDDAFAIVLPNDKDCIVFGRSTLHQSVIDQMKLGKNVVTCTAYLDGRNLDLMVTDATKRGEWFHNPEIGEHIEGNRYLSRKFEITEISFFDEAIYGDWRDMDDD